VSHKQQFAVIAGASFVAISQLATASSLNYYHRVAVAGFFFVLPICVFGFVWHDDFTRQNAKPYWIIRLLSSMGAGLFVGAVTMLAYSFTLWIGHTFFLSVIVVSVLIAWISFVRR